MLEKLLHRQVVTAEDSGHTPGAPGARHKYPDKDCVCRGAGKAPDAQILFDFLEKQLDIPAFIVDVDDHPWARVEIIGQKCGARAAP